jgi:hypothetical protein
MALRLLSALALSCLALLAASEQAAACSCARGPDDEVNLKREDAAVTARLLEVERRQNQGRALYIYSVRRVFKGRKHYDLHRGRRLRIRSHIGGASCGLPRNRERLYGLILYEWHGGLQANLCTLAEPRRLREAVEDRGSDRAGAQARPC